MAQEKINATRRQTNLPNESDKYLSKREELRLAEIELMLQRERVAELRRGLPQGAAIQDYAFEEGPANLDAGDTPIGTVRLSKLFSAPKRSLVVYHLMFGKKNTTPCPMCTLWVDGWNGVAHHLAQNVDVAIVAAADLMALRAHARARGWHRLRLLSCGANTFKYDLGSEDRDRGPRLRHKRECRASLNVVEPRTSLGERHRRECHSPEHAVNRRADGARIQLAQAPRWRVLGGPVSHYAIQGDDHLHQGKSVTRDEFIASLKE